MDRLKVAQYLEQNKDYLFPNNEISERSLENALAAAPEDFDLFLGGITFRNPSTVQIISVFPGSLGVDRFFLGDIGMGLLKYFTFGGVGIWWIADIFSAKDRCRAYNCKQLLEAINDPSTIAKMQNTNAAINNTIANAKKFTPVVGELVKGAKEVGKTFEHDNYY